MDGVLAFMSLIIPALALMPPSPRAETGAASPENTRESVEWKTFSTKVRILSVEKMILSAENTSESVENMTPSVEKTPLPAEKRTASVENITLSRHGAPLTTDRGRKILR